jgi:ribonuclease E
MKKEMLINVLQPEECRIAIVEDGVLEELYVERTSHESYVGNIYKGRIVNIEPSIQAAFVDFGVGRNGFLHVSDVEPAYYRHLEQRRGRDGGGGRRDGGRRDGGRGRQGYRSRDDDRRRPPDEPEPAFAEENDLEQALPADSIGMMDAEMLPEENFAEEPADEIAPEMEGGQPREGREQNEEKRGGRRGRGRGRGRGRRHRDDRREDARDPISPSAEPSSANEGEIREAQLETSPEGHHEDSPPEPPRLMDSAERRTDEDDPDLGSVEPTRELTDDDLSFSHPGPSEPAAVEPEPPSVAEADYPEAEPDLEPVDDFTPASEPGDVFGDDFEEEPHEQPRRHGRRDERRGDDRRGDRRGERGERGERRDDRRGGRRFPGQRGSGRPGAGRPKPLIQEIFKRGQEVLVQVIKEGIGTKGPTLSTYISIAGRYLVLMPGLNRIGVSRKITDEEQRRRLREVLNELKPPRGLGFIIRTAGLDRNKKELQRDLAYLSRLWQVVVRRIKKLKSPAEIYQESDMITRTIRDTFTSEIDTIWVDEQTAFDHAQEFLQIVMPRYASRIKHFAESEPMFHKYGIESEIARIQQRHVPLPNGGSIVIDQTEALVAIDVNSGNFRADNNAEETAFRMNLLAAKEIARQLRLRDLGGVIVNDFIDMREEKHRREVERAMREAVRRDRARTKILRISAFGIIEMTRQRIRPSLKRSVYQDCPHCGSTGQVKTCESMSIDVMRLLQLAAHREGVQRINVRVHEEVAHYLLNRKRKEVARLEETGNIQVNVNGVPGVSPELLEFTCLDSNNNEVKFMPYEETRMPRRRA